MRGNERIFAIFPHHPIPTPYPVHPAHPCQTPYRGNPMTLSEIRRRIDALKRRFARELAIIKLRRVAEAVADD